MICAASHHLAPKPGVPIRTAPRRPSGLSAHTFLPNSGGRYPTWRRRRTTHMLKSVREALALPAAPAAKRRRRKGEGAHGGLERMGLVCGLGYWMQGFRCFPWLALNFHMAHGLGVDPATLQLVQNVGNLPMVAKPLYGVLSDALYIGGAHRLPYISFGEISAFPIAEENSSLNKML